MTTWVSGKIIQIIHYPDQLFSIKINAEIDKFIAGQYAKIGIKINNKIIHRAYSYVNPPNNSNLEFYITKTIPGKLTTLLYNLKLNDTLMISKESYGRFILNEIPDQRSDLWMIASGTGIGPYLSMLESYDNKLKKLLNIILIHAVRRKKNLNYLLKMSELQKLYKGKLIIQTILSQERSPQSLSGRIPILIKNNLLEKTIGVYLHKNSHVMLCGNPQMIIDTKDILNKKYGMKFHSKNNTGHITQERYW